MKHDDRPATSAAPPYDVIVVGARCAGSPTAMLLARQGARVLVVDRATFPSDSMRGHFIRGTGTAALARWGLLDRVAATGAPPVSWIVSDLGDGPLTAPAAVTEGVDTVYGPRRSVLDALLVDEAIAAGAEVRQAFTVTDLLWEDGVVVGVRGQARGGRPVSERARLVVGADGMRSLVARQVGAPAYGEIPALTCGYYGYFDGTPLAMAEFGLHSGHTTFTMPTNDGLTLVFVAAPIAMLDAFRADLDAAFYRRLDGIPWIAGSVRSRRRVERWRGTGDLPNFFRRPFGPGWALVGDAGYHQDPISAQGISNAFRDAELLTAAIAAGLTGTRPMLDALASYERRRNEAVQPVRDEAIAWAKFQPFPPEVYAQRAARREAA